MADTDGEKLLSISKVRLYGERLTDMWYIDESKSPPAQHDTKKFVRVYGFGYEGGYYDLDAPIIMLLDGPAGNVSSDTPVDVKNAFSPTINEWVVEKSVDSIRLDSLDGSIEDILLEVELGGDMGHVSGGRVSGGRVSGGRVSGGRVSGGRVSGGRVSGGRVSGGKAD